MSNSIRVIKTTRQTYPTPVTYKQVVQDIVATEGVKSLFTRGLGTKIITNGIQGMMFTVLWKMLQNKKDTRTKN